MAKARLIGVNHVALEVGDLDAALDLYGRLFASSCAAACRARRSSTWATSSSPLMQGRTQAPDDERHFGLVVDDVAAVRAAVEREGLEIIDPGARGLDFRDPWGNHFQVVAYGAIQFERTPGRQAQARHRGARASPRRRCARSTSGALA